MCIEAYAAGLLDGEGCVTVLKHLNSEGRPQYQLMVVFGMNDREGLDAIRLRFGGNVNGPDHRGTYTWSASGVYALEFLKAVAPYALVKRTQVEVALSWAVGHRGVRLSDDDLTDREASYQALKGLKATSILVPCTT